MIPKEAIVVGAGAFILTNTTIILTLYAAGHFDENKSVIINQNHLKPGTNLPPQDQADERPAHTPYLRSIFDAMYICEDKFLSATASINKSYELKHTESYFSEDEEVYKIFIEYQTISTVDSPSESLDVTCEVSPITHKIVNYKEFPL